MEGIGKTRTCLTIVIDPVLLLATKRRAKVEHRTTSNFVRWLILRELGEDFTEEGGPCTDDTER